MSNSFEDEVDNYYIKFYANVHSNGSLGLAHKFMHKKLELRKARFFQNVLELGCGNFEHQNFIGHTYEFYTATDIRIPPDSEIANFLKRNKGNSFKTEDATNLSFPAHSFDRVVAGCLVVHFANVRQAINEWQRVTKLDGVIDFLVPCDPGLLSRIFRRIVSVPNAKKYGVQRNTYEEINAYEHVSSFSRTLRLVKSEIQPGRKLKVHYFPFPFLKSWNLNAFAIFSIE
jgi:ubiquinone/menaquinone biosynthesis C-methylase UbiE